MSLINILINIVLIYINESITFYSVLKMTYGILYRAKKFVKKFNK